MSILLVFIDAAYPDFSVSWVHYVGIGFLDFIALVMLESVLK